MMAEEIDELRAQVKKLKRKLRKAKVTEEATPKPHTTVLAEKVEVGAVIEPSTASALADRLEVFVKEEAEKLGIESSSLKEGLEATQPELKKVGGRRWWLVGVGLACIALAYFAMVLYSQDRANMFMGLGAILALGGGGFAVFYGIRSEGAGVIIDRDKEAEKLANSLNIYPDRIVFEELPVEQLMGQPQRCRNDGQFYNVHIWDRETDKLKAFILPDTQYRDPREFANNLNIPAHRGLAEHDVSMAQKIAPAALVAGIGIMAFLFLVVE